MPALNLDRWLSGGDTSRKRGRQCSLRTRKDKESFRIVRAGLNVDFKVDPRDGTGDVKENHHMLKALVVLGDVVQLKRLCLKLC